jgi:hypothetical protein
MSVVSQYVRALREEPRLRAFAAASFVDDVGLAVSAWAAELMMTNLFTSQRARASLQLPALVCFLLGTVVSGPLADWAARFSLARLARWRWRLVIWARLAEVAMGVFLLTRLAAGAPTIASILPFVMLGAFTKTAFRPTRIAFGVDLLSHESVQADASGSELRDERGEPLRYKTHLLTMTSLTGALAAAAAFGGLLVGGRILDLAAGRYAPLFFIQGLTQLGFVAVIFFFCHPTRPARAVRVLELFRDDASDDPVVSARSSGEPARLSPVGAVGEFGRSLRDGVRFLLQPQQRSLCILLMGAMLVEMVTESYDGKMIVKHVLGGTDDSVRYAEIAWAAVGMVGVALVPALTRAVGSIGRIFLVTMLVDGVVIMAAGQVAGAGAAASIVPFTVILCADHSLTLASGSLTDLATNSASSAAMRGRIAGTYALFVILGDMFVEWAATAVSEAVGIPGMLVRVGLLQVVVVLLLAAWGKRRLWQFGLREEAGPLVVRETRTA